MEKVYSHGLDPFPAEISQADKQLVRFVGNHFVFTPYPVQQQTTKLLLASANVESYTKLKPSQLTDTTITLGPYENQPEYSQVSTVPTPPSRWTRTRTSPSTRRSVLYRHHHHAGPVREPARVLAGQYCTDTTITLDPYENQPEYSQVSTVPTPPSRWARTRTSPSTRRSVLYRYHHHAGPVREPARVLAGQYCTDTTVTLGPYENQPEYSQVSTVPIPPSRWARTRTSPSTRRSVLYRHHHHAGPVREPARVLAGQYCTDTTITLGPYENQPEYSQVSTVPVPPSRWTRTRTSPSTRRSVLYRHHHHAGPVREPARVLAGQCCTDTTITLGPYENQPEYSQVSTVPTPPSRWARTRTSPSTRRSVLYRYHHHAGPVREPARVLAGQYCTDTTITLGPYENQPEYSQVSTVPIPPSRWARTRTSPSTRRSVLYRYHRHAGPVREPARVLAGQCRVPI